MMSVAVSGVNHIIKWPSCEHRNSLEARDMSVGRQQGQAGGDD